jgi:Leucine-rich repeat (LRR) protein
MTKHNIKSQTMKTLLTILLFATSLCYAQPAITNPTPLSVCDNDSDGFSVFNLTSKNAEILGSLLASNHTISYHETFSDATIGVNSLGSNYSNVNPFNQVVYVRVIENSDPANPSTAVLELVVNAPPVISPTPVSLTVCDAYILPALPSNQNYFTGPNGTGTILFAGDVITSTQTINILAQSGTNPICTAEESFVVTIIATPVTPNPSDVIACEAYTLPALPFGQSYHSVSGGNPVTEVPAGTAITSTQTIYVLAQSGTTPNCTSEASFTVTIGALPTFNTPSDLIQNDPDGTAVFDLTSQIASITTNPGYTVSFYTTIFDAQAETNEILTPTAYVNSTNPQTIGVRVIDPATGCFSITSFQLIVNNNAFPINNPTPLQVCDDNADGIAVFNIDSKNAEILGSLSSSQYTVTYYENQFAAQLGGFGNILSPYFNVIPNNQTVYARVELNSDSSIFSTTSLQLIVNPIPAINTPIPNLTVYENPTDGVAVFDLTVQTSFILNGDPSVNVVYYITQVDAFNQANPIANPSAYSGMNNQVIWANAQNSTGCFDVASFVLNVTNSSNIIIFSDSNFKAKLLTSSPTNQVAYSGSGYVKIDANNDNEIQFTEAAVIDSLNVGYANIVDVTGIAGFSNLKRFNCRNNQIVTLNLTSNTTLQELFAISNSINSINVNGLLSLKTLQVISNQISTINLSSLVALENFYCSSNLLTTLDLSANVNIKYFYGDQNNISSINLTGLSALQGFSSNFNSISSLNFDNLTNLEFINCLQNDLTTLSVNNCPSLISIDCSGNNLTSLNTSTATSLEALNCGYNQISALQLNLNSNLLNLNCESNSLTTLDLTNNINIEVLNCPSNLLTTLFIKNGSSFASGLEFSNNPTLQYICCDDFNVAPFQSLAQSFGYLNCNINSFCSFTPGGNFNTITGTAIIDGNNNGCDASDATMPYLGLNISLNGVSTNTSVYTNGLGIYNLFATFPGIYQLTASLENPTYFNVSSVEVDSNTINDLTILQNICITPNGTHPDVEVVLAPIDPARPGFNASYELVYKNKGNQTLSGTVTLNYNDSVLDYVSTTIAPTSQAAGVINWSYSNLQPFENRSIGLVLNVNSPVETPAVNIGDILTFTATITPIVGDEIPADNTFVFNQTVVGSYDPNDITCLQGDTVSPSEIGNYLHYVINFENTGTYYAENVVVQDIIDTTQYDISSLQILNASHNMDARINGNVVEFVFQNINLAAVAGNPPVGGHGNVLFKIKSKSNLVTGDQVIKKASIFFDYNAPIITNDAETTYTSLSNGGFNPDDSLSVYPNPTSSILNITSENTIESIELYDIQGRILEKSFQNSNAVILDISNRQSGVYFLKITSDKGSKVEKVVKK